jgi:ATP-dependent DNA ligase
MLKLKIINKVETDEYTNTNDLFEGDLINISESPSTESWKYIPLFKEGNIGETRVWQIGFERKEERLKTVHGILITSKGENGKLITAYHPIVENKSGRSLQEQALLEARKRYLDQFHSGYLPRGEQMPTELNGVEPMLANTLKLSSDDTKKKSNETRIEKYPVSVMKKLDGIRSLVRYTGNETIQMRSRNNKNHEAPLSHIKEELLLFFPYLPQSAELDGELYSMDMGFDELSGVIRTKKRKHEKHDLVKFYIFDLIEPRKLYWEERYKVLVEAFRKYVEDGNPCKYLSVLQSYYVYNEEDLLKHHGKFISEGFEGIIIRRCSFVEVNCCKEFLKEPEKMCKKCAKGYNLTVYRSKRSNALMKYKLFQDEEAVIIGFEKGTGTEEGAIIFCIKDIRENEFTIRPRGTIEERRKLYKKGDKLIGKKLTIRYQELTEKGVPRFPVAIAIRDYE